MRTLPSSDPRAHVRGHTYKCWHVFFARWPASMTEQPTFFFWPDQISKLYWGKWRKRTMNLQFVLIWINYIPHRWLQNLSCGLYCPPVPEVWRLKRKYQVWRLKRKYQGVCFLNSIDIKNWPTTLLWLTHFLENKFENFRVSINYEAFKINLFFKSKFRIIEQRFLELGGSIML